MVLALDHAARIGPGCDMTEADVTRERAKERNPLADEHGQTTDDQAVYEPGTQELLNGDSTVHVETAGTGCSKFGDNLGRRSRYQLNDPPRSRARDRSRG